MADFARLLAAVDQLHGTDGLGRFYKQARAMAEDSLTADPFVAALLETSLDFDGGTAAELLARLTPHEGRPPSGWPKSPRAVTGILRRNAPALRKAGWVVEEDTDRNHFTVWPLTHPEKVGNDVPLNPQDPHGAEYAEHTEYENAPSKDEQPQIADLAEHAEYENAPSKDEQPATNGHRIPACAGAERWDACANTNCRTFAACVLSPKD